MGIAASDRLRARRLLADLLPADRLAHDLLRTRASGRVGRFDDGHDGDGTTACLAASSSQSNARWRSSGSSPRSARSASTSLTAHSQHVQPVPHRLELLTCDDELTFAEPELGTPPPRLVVALAARLPAEPPRPPRSPAHRDPPPTPHARVFRHSDNIAGGVAHPTRPTNGLLIAEPSGCRREIASDDNRRAGRRDPRCEDGGMSVGGTARYRTATHMPPLVVRAAVLGERAAGSSTRASRSRAGLLRVLAAGRAGGRIGETGTGCGVGLAWLVSGADATTTFVSVERDADLADAHGWSCSPSIRT